MLRHTIPGIALLLLVGLFWVGLDLNPRELPSPLVGKKVPDFEVPDLKESGRRLTQNDLRNHVTLFNVWASWCTSCRAEHHLLVALQREGVRIVGLNYKDRRDAALKYLGAGGNPFQAIGFDASGKVGIDWGVYGTPETFIVDRRGVIRYKHTGPLSVAIINDKIIPLLEALEREPL